MFPELIRKYNLNHIKFFLASKSFFVLSSALVLIFSIFVISSKDIGSDSGIYIDIGRKFAEGGKYYDQIFESNFPLNFYIYAFEYRISQVTKIHPVILSQICIYIFFFICLFCCLRIIKKTTIYDDKIFVNLLFLIFFIGFFLRHPSIELNELGTKSTFFMLFFFPYLLYSLELKIDLSRKDLIYRGILMGLIPCFKPNYAIVVIGIELFKFFENKTWRFIFRLDHLVALLVGLAMLDWMIFFEKEYFQFMIPMWREFYGPYSDINIFIERIKRLYLIIIPCLGICFLYLSRIKDLSYNLKINFIAFISALLMLTSEGLASIDQVSNLFLIIFIFCLFFFYNKTLISILNIAKNKFIFFSLVIVSIADYSSIQTAIFGVYSVFWCLWILVPVYAIYYLRQKKISSSEFIKFIILYLLFCVTLYYLIIKHDLELIAIYCIIFNFTICYLYETRINLKQSANFSLISFTMIISVPIMLFFNLTNSVLAVFKKDSFTNSLFESSDKLYYYIKKYAPNKNDQILVFTNKSYILKFPNYNYLGKENKIKSSTHFFINYRLIKKTNINKESSYIFTPNEFNIFFLDKYFYDQMIDSLQSDEYKLIFLAGSLEGLCSMPFIEYLAMVKQYKKLLNDNFQYVDSINIIQYHDNYEQNQTFEINGKNYKLIDEKFINTSIEIYARKTKVKN